MRHSLLVIHIIGGGIGLFTGFIALYATKGARVHRRVGLAFVVAILVMSLGALAYMAAARSAHSINIIAATLTTYLVTTSLVSVKPLPWWNRSIDVVALFIVIMVVVAGALLGRVAMTSPHGMLEGIPAFPYFLFATTGALCVIGDLRMLRGRLLDRRSQLVRHLWRMSFALFIAALSFFLGQADEIPKVLRIPALLALPPIAVLVTMLYWLWRVRLRGYRFGARAIVNQEG